MKFISQVIIVSFLPTAILSTLVKLITFKTKAYYDPFFRGNSYTSSTFFEPWKP